MGLAVALAVLLLSFRVTKGRHVRGINYTSYMFSQSGMLFLAKKRLCIERLQVHIKQARTTMHCCCDDHNVRTWLK